MVISSNCSTTLYDRMKKIEKNERHIDQYDPLVAVRVEFAAVAVIAT